MTTTDDSPPDNQSDDLFTKLFMAALRGEETIELSNDEEKQLPASVNQYEWEIVVKSAQATTKTLQSLIESCVRLEARITELERKQSD